jgi:uncharacterized delta-60 repeat protein
LLNLKGLIALTLAMLLLSTNALSTPQAAGSLDSTFGNGGKVTTNIKLSEGASGVVLQVDGKIVVAGEASDIQGPSRFALLRYNTDSTLDSSFGVDGKVTTGFDLGSGASDLAIQPDGKIVVAGTAFSNSSDSLDFALVRYNTDGSLDLSFGSGGKVLTDFHGFFDAGSVLALQADGKIVVGGNVVRDPSLTDFVLVRYNSDGSLDSSFGNGGIVTTDFFGRADVVLDLALQPDGKIVATGHATNPARGLNSLDVALARYKADGSLDPTFGSGGKVTTSFENGEGAVALGLQHDGKIVVAGNGFSAVTGGDFVLLRYNTDGSLDSSFGSGGKVTTDIVGADQARALAIYPNGKIVVGGTVRQPGFFRNEDFALARYNTDGSLDTIFGSGGKVTTDFSGESDADSLSDLAIQPDGKIIAVGASSITNSDFALARYETTMPAIQSVSIQGKKLFVMGRDFDDGAVILINGEMQQTKNDAANRSRVLISKKGGKKIKRGETATLQTRNSDGTLSPAFRFTRPTE